MQYNHKILLLVPTNMELQRMSLDHLNEAVEIAVCGFGPVSTAIFLTQQLSRSKYPLILLVGLAGAYPGMGVGVGDVCVAESEVYADLGRCFANGIEPIAPPNEIVPMWFDLRQDWHSDLKACIHHLMEEMGTKIVRMATVCCVSCTSERAKYISQGWNVAVENMEGAAAAQVCALCHIPFVEIRSVSNMVGDCNRSNWQIETALKGLSDFIQAFLPRLRQVL